MRIVKVWIILGVLLSLAASAQENKTRNIIIVTLDGYRWRELFMGADPDIAYNHRYVKDTSVWQRFVDPSASVSRAKLMPFFWEVIAERGQLYGNRKFKNRVNCSNIHLLSYPGYSEMLVGYPDSDISSNAKIENPNPTILEFISHKKGFERKVAAFSTWDAFPYILREQTSGIPVNSGYDLAEGNISEIEKKLNEDQGMVKGPGPRSDVTTFTYALEYLKRERPRVMFLGFDETDQNGHGGRYDEYLKAAHRSDQLIRQLWNWVQSDPGYKDQTTLFITTDHGRGSGKNNWKNHRLAAPGSGQIWFAVLGPDTPPFGELKFKSRFYQKQVARTIASFLGLQYQPTDKVGDAIQTMVALPVLMDNDVTTVDREINSPVKNQ